MIVPKLGFVLLFVENPTLSGAFYKKILGREPIEAHPTFQLFQLANDVQLGLWSRYTAEPHVSITGGGAEISFAEDDVDDVYERFKQHGIPIIQTPTDMDFGRTFVALDPDGHRIRIYRLHEVSA